MKSIKLTKIKVRDLAEIFQALDIKFAFVNKNHEEVTTPAKCRDFLGDCIYSCKKKTKVSIYGFNYNYVDAPYDDCRFSLKFPDGQSQENFIANLSYLHEREKQAGVKLSKIYTTQEKDTLVIEGANHWISAIWKVSLYTYFIKVMSYKSVADLQRPESKYAAKLTPEKEAKLLSKIKTLKTEKLPAVAYEAHNDMGFYSIITGNSINSKLVLA